MQRAKQSLDEQIRIAALLTEVDGEIQKVGRFLFRQVERERFQAEKQLKSKARKTEQKTMLIGRDNIFLEVEGSLSFRKK